MKLFKRFTVEGKECQLVSEDIRLEIDRPGMAVIQVVAEETLSGKVEFSLGWNHADRMILFFSGEIDGESKTVDHKQQRMICLELSARLDKTAPLALRHPTMREVLRKYGEMTGLTFIVPDKPYADTRVPAFYGLGSSFHALKNLGAVFHIDDYVWLTQGDGNIFAGSWEDSRWKGKEIEIPEKMFRKTAGIGAFTMTALPALRPGCHVNGRRVTTVNFSGHEMNFTSKPV